jgi:hypothetical protein
MAMPALTRQLDVPQRTQLYCTAQRATVSDGAVLSSEELGREQSAMAAAIRYIETTGWVVLVAIAAVACQAGLDPMMIGC